MYSPPFVVRVPADNTEASVRLTLFGRTYCHLCDDMAAALAPIVARTDASVEIVDVDSDPALEARFGDRVPVLFAGADELCHYFLDGDRVKRALGLVS